MKLPFLLSFLAVAALAGCASSSPTTEGPPATFVFDAQFENNGTKTLHVWFNLTQGETEYRFSRDVAGGETFHHLATLPKQGTWAWQYYWKAKGEEVGVPGVRPLFEDGFGLGWSLGVNATLCQPNEVYTLWTKAWYANSNVPVAAAVFHHELNVEKDWKGCNPFRHD